MGASTTEGRSFYFFDFDKNVMKVTVPFVARNVKTNELRKMPAGQYFKIEPEFGQPGPWQDWSGDHAMMYYGDLPDLPPDQQPFPEQIRSAIDSGNPGSWKAPSFDVFVHACNTGREISLITARAHSDDTVRAGFAVLQNRGFIEHPPRFLTIYNVTRQDTLQALGNPPAGPNQVEELKRRAIIASVGVAVERYGGTVPHRFGMSDDTMLNIEGAADAMRQCKQTHPAMRFFVIATNANHLFKAEIFPVSDPVTWTAGPDARGPLDAHL